jgi:predicted aldo/keto reductase-like oxidoreductase
VRCIEASLRRLNADYIDLWQFHGINTFEYYEQILGPGGGMEGAQEALQAGKIRHIGFSSHSLEVALKAVAAGHFETVQFPLISSPMRRRMNWFLWPASTMWALSR